MRNKVLVTLVTTDDSPPVAHKIAEGLREAVKLVVEIEPSHRPYRAVLENLEVLQVRVFEEGEDFQIVPAAAAAGEVRAFGTLDTVLYAEDFFCLSVGQRNRAESLLKDWLAPTSVQVLTAQLSKATNTLIASIRLRDDAGQCTEQLYTQTLLPGTASFIFG